MLFFGLNWNPSAELESELPVCKVEFCRKRKSTIAHGHFAIVDDYIIEKTKDRYYDTLEASDAGWHEEKSAPTPFIRYMLQTILACYTDLHGPGAGGFVRKVRYRPSDA